MLLSKQVSVTSSVACYIKEAHSGRHDRPPRFFLLVCFVSFSFLSFSDFLLKTHYIYFQRILPGPFQRTLTRVRGGGVRGGGQRM